MLYVAIDTNGLPNTVQGFNPVVVALAVARIDGGVVHAQAGLVRQPRYMIDHPYTYGALLANGLTAEQVCAAPTTPEAAAAGLRRLLAGPPPHRPRGYAGQFMARSLAMPPWSFRPDEWADPVMAEAALAIHGGKIVFTSAGTVVRPRKGQISLDKACAWAAERGHDVVGPAGPVWTAESGVLHCHHAVVRAAKLALVLTGTGATHSAIEAAKAAGGWATT